MEPTPLGLQDQLEHLGGGGRLHGRRCVELPVLAVAHPSGAAPGRLTALDARDGAVLDRLFERRLPDVEPGNDVLQVLRVEYGGRL